MCEDSKNGLEVSGELTVTNDNKLSIFDPGSVHNIIFSNEHSEEVGRLTFGDNQIHFTGKADEAAKVFFEHFLKPMCDGYIKEKLENGTEQATTNSPEARNGD